MMQSMMHMSVETAYLLRGIITFLIFCMVYFVTDNYVEVMLQEDKMKRVKRDEQ